MAENQKWLEDKEANRQVRRSYHSKQEFTKKNYLNKKIEKFKGNGKKAFLI